MSLPNPYRPGSTPRHLAGRDTQLTAIRQHLAPVIAYGEMAGPPLVLHGPRGVGKTSLLDVAVQRAQADGLLVAWTSCVRDQPVLADLRDSVTRALTRAGVRTDDAEWGLALQKLGLEIGVPNMARLSAEVSRRGPGAAERATGAVTALEDFLHLAATSARAVGGGSGAGLVVAIDELHAAPLGELGVLLNAIQNLDRERERTPLAVLGAGVPSVRGQITRAATFGERSDWLAVGDLTDEQATDALRTPAAELGVTWEDDALALAVAHSQSYPHFVQIMGRAAWRAADPGRGDTITVAHTNAGTSVGGAEVADLYAARWEAATDQERHLMRTMAEIGRDDDVRRADLEAALGIDISGPRQRLLNSAVVAASGHGRLRFTLPGFADWVLTETGQDG